jgi:hypothetical protein
MPMMFDRETDDFVDSKLDMLGLHVLLILRSVVRRRSETPTEKETFFPIVSEADTATL